MDGFKYLAYLHSLMLPIFFLPLLMSQMTNYCQKIKIQRLRIELIYTFLKKTENTNAARN